MVGRLTSRWCCKEVSRRLRVRGTSVSSRYCSSSRHVRRQSNKSPVALGGYAVGAGTGAGRGNALGGPVCYQDAPRPNEVVPMKARGGRRYCSSSRHVRRQSNKSPVTLGGYAVGAGTGAGRGNALGGSVRYQDAPRPNEGEGSSPVRGSCWC